MELLEILTLGDMLYGALVAGALIYAIRDDVLIRRRAIGASATEAVKLDKLVRRL